MRGTRTSLSRTNTALWRDLVVHVEGDKLIFLSSCCNLGANWEVTLRLLSCRIMQLWIIISPEVPQPKGAGIRVTVTVATSKKILLISTHQENALSPTPPMLLPFWAEPRVLAPSSVLWLLTVFDVPLLARAGGFHGQALSCRLLHPLSTGLSPNHHIPTGLGVKQTWFESWLC